MTINVKETKFSIWKSFLLLFVIAIVAVAIGFFIISDDVNGVDIDSSITIEIPEGAGSATVANQLYQNGIINHILAFRIYSKLGGYDGNYQPGMIMITGGMSYDDILKTLVTTDRNSIKITIPEGYTLTRIAQTLADAGLCTTDEFYSALDPSLYNYRFLEGIPDRNARLEGYLFPATYDIVPGMTAQDIVNLMLKSFDEHFTDAYYVRAKELGFTVDEVVTFASIIERETNSDTERAKVAGVFYNRLKINMPLESCATVQYILGENKPVLSVEDTQIDSPYNTYRNYGLPIGPIASPGTECIKAVLYPEDTDALFFVLGANGEHIFSETYEEHVKAMNANGL